MAKSLDPQTLLNKWQRGMAGASQNYIDGINSVTESPMAKAASDAATQAYIAGVQRSVSSGRRQQALNNASLATYKTNATTIGAQRLADGARKGAAKYAAAMQKWAPIYQQASQAAAAVNGPKSLSTAVAKMQAAVQVMMAAAGTA